LNDEEGIFGDPNAAFTAAIASVLGAVILCRFEGVSRHLWKKHGNNEANFPDRPFAKSEN